MNLSKKELSESARQASSARWEQWLIDHPDKADKALKRRAKRKAAGKKQTKKKIAA